MASSTPLQQHLSKLETPGPVQLYAISAIFDTACQGASSPPSSPAEAALLQCLCLPDGQGAGVAVEKLIDAVKMNKLDENTAQSLLLTALAVASPAAAIPLTAGCIDLWSTKLAISKTNTPQMPWKSHLLSKAWLASPYAGPELVSGVGKALTVAAAGPKVDFAGNLTALKPFLSFTLLHPMSSERHPHATANLHSSLVRAVAAPSAKPSAQHAMLRMLTSFLPALQVKTPEQQSASELFVADVMDLLEACQEEPSVDIVDAFISGLLSLSTDMFNAGSSIAPCIAALASLATYWPESVLLSAAPRLMVKFAESGSKNDSMAALSLLSSLLPTEGAAGHAALQPWTRAELTVQLIPNLAFGQIVSVKEWISAALSAVQKFSPVVVSESQTITRQEESNVLLRMLWTNSQAAICWLRSLESDLESQSSATSSSSNIQLAPSTAQVMLSLLCHPSSKVSSAAVEAAIAAVHSAPLLGLTALPVMIYKLHSLVEIFLKNASSAQDSKAPKLLLQILYALPHLAVHPSSVPFIVRALQPLLAPPAPELLQAVALRMLCDMWTNTGRGFPHLRTALLSYATPSGGRRVPVSIAQAEDPSLRLAWAATLAEVCAHDGNRAAELIQSINECLTESRPEIQVFGLTCIAELCESDTLDFYKAWKVVLESIPTLPNDAAAAAAWVRLLASGGLDATVHPEVAKGIVNALWKATKHPLEAVRSQACASLAHYDFLSLEQMEALSQEMWEYSALLQEESSTECEALVLHVLRYEHATRRRQKGQSSGGSGKARLNWGRKMAAMGASDEAGMLHRLAVTLPKALLGGGSRAIADFLPKLPNINSNVVLLLWAPPPPPASSSSSKAAAAVAAKHAVDAYTAVFKEACKYTAGTMEDASSPGSKNSVTAAMHAWASFLKRWCNASRDAVGGTAASQNERIAAGVNTVWSVVKASLESSNVAIACGAANAAAALATLHPQPVKNVVEEVLAVLIKRAQKAEQGVLVQAACCAALGQCADVARSISGLPAATAALTVLQTHLGDESCPAAVRAASALGLGIACNKLSKVAATAANIGDLTKRLLLCLLAAAASHLPAALAQEIEASVWEPMLEFPEIQCPSDCVDSVLSGLAAAVPAVVALGLTAVLPLLRQAALHLLEYSCSSCVLLQVCTLAAFKSKTVGSNEAIETLNILQEMVESGLASGQQQTSASGAEESKRPHGKIAGAAASALGELIPGLLREGFVFSDRGGTADEFIRFVLELSEKGQDSGMSNIAAAHIGSAYGIASMLKARVQGHAVAFENNQEKRALELIEVLAIKDDDIRVRHGASKALAELCWEARHNSAVSASSENTEASINTDSIAMSTSSQAVVQPKALTALPENSALRYLCETAGAGAWPAVEDEETDEVTTNGLGPTEQAVAVPLSADQAASVLRVLAAAPRLPALDWSATCRRLLRTHFESVAVQEAVVALAAAHAASSQVLQMYDFVSGDVLGQSGLKTWDSKAQIDILEALPQLLPAVPDAEAVGAIRMLCTTCPEGQEGLAWQVALLQGLAEVSNSKSTQSDPSVVEAAWQSAVEIILPKLPPPPSWPLNLKISALEMFCMEKTSVSKETNAWIGLLKCALAAPEEALDRLCQDVERFSKQPQHWAWICSAIAVNGAKDLRVLQQPRNFILKGALSGVDETAEDVAIMWTVRALIGVSTVSMVQKQQWISDILHAAQSCDNPQGAVKLAACAAVALATALGGGVAAEHSVLATCETALESLPDSLRVLAEKIEPCPVPLLTSLVKLEGLLGDGSRLKKACCYALRHALAADLWADMCVALE